MATQGVSGIAVGAAAAGALLIWSGLRGAKVTTAVRQLASGHQPTSGALPITDPAAAAAAGGAPGAAEGSGGSLQTLNPAQRSSWSEAFLSALGAPLTAANVTSVNSWQAREGGGGANNPLNTTMPAPGATDFNSVGVKNYPSVSEGISASVSTITGGNYADVLMALRSGQGLCGRSWAGLSTWSGGGYSSVC